MTLYFLALCTYLLATCLACYLLWRVGRARYLRKRKNEVLEKTRILAKEVCEK